jgi:lipoate-protein ligase A
MTFGALPSSFRDPSGFVFAENRRIYRQVNKSFSENFDQFIASGLYKILVAKGYLIAHEDVTASSVKRGPDCHRVLAPEIVPYISYPYEWSFSQLKDAAMLTLRIQTIALQHGYILKDASAYNVQFVNGKPVFIDTLSFEPYIEGTPWVAYRQFCQHFLAPLALMARVDVGLGKLLVTYIDGIPLSLVSNLLPLTTRLIYSIQNHIHLHAKMQDTYADAAGSSTSSKNSDGKNQRQLSKTGLQAIVESLASAIQGQQWTPPQTEWGDYYDNTNYTDGSTDEKRRLVEEYLVSIDSPLNVVHDLGANTGEFSRIAGKHAGLVVSQDIDPVAVERNYRRLSTETCKNILPLLQDLYAPSPAIGWGNEERDSFRQRGQCDAIMALALVHHLAISNNTPLGHIAALFAELAQWLVIEFVPKSDSQVERLLKTREDVFPHYNRQGFEEAFSKYFTLIKDQAVAGSERRLYLMRSLISAKTSSGGA